MQDEEDRALCSERLSWILSNSPRATGQDFGAVTSYALTADLAGLASSESSSSYVDFCCDESALQERQEKSYQQPMSCAALTAFAAAHASQSSLCSTLHPNDALASRSQQPSWPLPDLLEIIRYGVYPVGASVVSCSPEAACPE